MKDSIKIGPHFFQQEKRNYSDWRTALIREIIQNSVDSVGCTRISFLLGKNKSNSNSIIEITDNGSGMSRDVLENVFLSLGETTKTGNTTGGFGKARVLICFAQVKYTIISDNYTCIGSGAEYEIKPNKSKREGCSFTIETDNYDWETTIKEVLKKCTVHPSIYINGERFNEKLRQSKLIRELSFGKVFVNKSAEPGVHIRVNGTWMFSKYSDIKAQVCVEINSNISREVLTANRDGLQYKYDNELQAFLNELAANTKSALNDKTRHFTKFLNKGLGFKSRPKTKQEIKDFEPLCYENDKPLTKDQVIKSFGANPIDEQFLPVYQQDPILSSMIILNESNDPKRVQLIKNFYMPEKWENRAATRYQLVRIWFSICQIVMDELSNLANSEFSWAVGFNFSDEKEGEESLAMHLQSGGIHYLMFNPITSSNTLKYSVNSVDDFFNLTVLAAHEASHCIYSNHTEDFSSLFTILTQKVLSRRKEIVNNCKEAKNN